MKVIYHHQLGKPLPDSSIQKDIKLSHHPPPESTAIPGEEFDILMKNLALSEDEDYMNIIT